MRILLSALASLALGFPAAAADMTVTLRSATGQPVRDAVVSFRPAVRVAPPRPAARYEVAQKNIQFIPLVTIVPMGAQVVFPNHDKVRHHVYSFSPAKRFELKLYGREEQRTVLFDKAGVVALGCNIHDGMVAFIVVTDTPFVAKSDAAGRVTLTGLPEGAGGLTVWHPDLRAPRSEMARQIPMAGGAQAFVMDMRPPPPGRVAMNLTAPSGAPRHH